METGWFFVQREIAHFSWLCFCFGPAVLRRSGTDCDGSDACRLVSRAVSPSGAAPVQKRNLLHSGGGAWRANLHSAAQRTPGMRLCRGRPRRKFTAYCLLLLHKPQFCRIEFGNGGLQSHASVSFGRRQTAARLSDDETPCICGSPRGSAVLCVCKPCRYVLRLLPVCPAANRACGHDLHRGGSHQAFRGS